MVRTIVKVVSLEKSRERRALFSNMLASARVEWSFFDAYDTVPDSIWYDDKASLQRFGRQLTLGELGCFSSHLMVWRNLIASPYDQMLVLEDDVIVDWSAIEQLAAFDIASVDMHLVRLFSTHTFPADLVVQRFLSPHHHLLRCTGKIFGTQGYLLSRKCAEALIGFNKKIFEPLDWSMSKYWEYGIINYCVFPFPLLERFSKSSIGSEGRETLAVHSFRDRAKRLGWRGRDRFKRECFNRLIFRSDPFGRSSDIGAAFVSRFEQVAHDQLE